MKAHTKIIKVALFVFISCIFMANNSFAESLPCPQTKYAFDPFMPGSGYGDGTVSLQGGFEGSHKMAICNYEKEINIIADWNVDNATICNNFYAETPSWTLPHPCLSNCGILFIGMCYQGGIIAYIDSTGQHRLNCCRRRPKSRNTMV